VRRRRRQRVAKSPWSSLPSIGSACSDTPRAHVWCMHHVQPDNFSFVIDQKRHAAPTINFSLWHNAVVLFQKMLRWIVPVFLMLFSLCASMVHADTIRGVNLGGWLLVEEWCVATFGRLQSLSILTITGSLLRCSITRMLKMNGTYATIWVKNNVKNC
jgi:hypothetical protein